MYISHCSYGCSQCIRYFFDYGESQSVSGCTSLIDYGISRLCSRNEMLMWVNDCLQAQFSKIEELHTGAGYCQVSTILRWRPLQHLFKFTDFLFPGTIQLKKVKWNSRLELDWLSNWKVSVDVSHQFYPNENVLLWPYSQLLFSWCKLVGSLWELIKSFLSRN